MIIKCKMCGGDLNIQEGNPICECEFCGSQQTVPQPDNEKKINLFNRANYLRMNAEFDKAAAVYESIVAEFPGEAEAYWGLCLCTYGIEYVDDPATGEKKPTCHRTLPVSIMENSNFEQACDYADGVARRTYREEAKAIDRIQQDILQIVANEEPYDVFICYKETAEEGGRTEDSVLAQDIYDALTEKGLKVFFSRITLEDKLGQQYEPYIYAALSSAKVMLAIGTKFEYYDAVWVKNEWMRFLSMMKTDKGKTLIPCYKDLDAYDMPKEFKNLQGQDLGKIGAIQDLLRGVEKILGTKKNQQNEQIDQDSKQVDTAIKRAKLFLEGKEWDKAIEYCEKALDINPEHPRAYLARELAERQCSNISELALYFYLHKPTESDSLRNARRFADSETQFLLDGLDAKTKTAPEDLKKKYVDDIKKEKSLPNWPEKKEKLEHIRKRATLLSNRIYNEPGHTIVLDTEGRMHCTKTSNDRFGTFDDGIDFCTAWRSRLHGFCVENKTVYGYEIDGHIIKTDNKKNGYTDAFSENWRDLSTWVNVKEIKNYAGFIYGIMENGTVRVTGHLSDKFEYHGQDKVEHLCNIKTFINSVQGRVFFLSNDGTVKSTEYIGENNASDVWNELSEWTDIKEAGYIRGRFYGVHSDGTNVMTNYFNIGEDDSGGKEAEAWTGIIQYETGWGRTIGLTETGKVLVTDYYDKSEEDPQRRESYLDMRKWEDIACLYVTNSRVMAITMDGEVKSAVFMKDCVCDQNGEDNKMFAFWHQIAALEVGYFSVFGVKKDGSMVSAGQNNHGDTDVSNIRIFKKYDNIPDEIANTAKSVAAEKERELERKKEEERKHEEEIRQEQIRKCEKATMLHNEIESLNEELANLKGLFSGKRRKEIQEQINMMQNELRTLNK